MWPGVVCKPNTEEGGGCCRGEESVHGQWQRSVSDVDQKGVMTLARIRSIFDSKPPFVRGAGGIGRVEFNARSADVSVARRGALGEREAIRETRAVIVE